MIFPGVAGYEEIQANHGRVVTRTGKGLGRHPRCEPGVVEGNPVAEEIAIAAGLHPPTLALCLVPGSDGRTAWAAAGDWRVAFDAAREMVRRWYRVSHRPVPLVVASAGGAPADRTLIQAHKGLDAACRHLEPGGELLLVARIEGGPGSPEMEPFLDDPEPASILERLQRCWVQYGHTTLRLVEKTRAHTVHLVSELDPALARRLGFHPVGDPDAVIERWRGSRPGAAVGAMTGAAVYPDERA